MKLKEMSRSQLIIKLEDYTGSSNVKGTLSRCFSSIYYRKPGEGQDRSEPTDSELRILLANTMLDAQRNIHNG